MVSRVLLFREALYGALVIALACSVIGVYVVLRRIVFVGAAIAQLSSAGIALALFLAGHGFMASYSGNTTTFALFFALAGAMFFGLGGGQRAGIPPDATIGVGYAVAAAAGILLISKVSVVSALLAAVVASHSPCPSTCPQGRPSSRSPERSLYSPGRFAQVSDADSGCPRTMG
jgi:ABC-type Mn2+/Zn2+ transport system permease subunit